MIGKTISHYKILAKLGEGGMGVVYKAEDIKLKRYVALKYLPHHLSISNEDNARLLNEAQMTAKLNHPHICTIYDIEEADEEKFIVMEFVDGVTLREKIRKNLLSIDESINYAIQIGEALEEAHSQGIIHRDIKPDNIMINSKNQIKVMDFGIAKLKEGLGVTMTMSTSGTVSYMAPEQLSSSKTDGRVDIFSLGILLYEMLTSKLPFRGEHQAAMMYSIMNEEPEPINKYLSEVPSEMLHVLNRALEKDPEDRYQNVHDMVIDLRRLKKQTSEIKKHTLKGEHFTTGSDQKINSPEKTKSTFKKNFIFIILGAAILITLIILFIHPSNSIQINPEMNSQAINIPYSNVEGASMSSDGKWVVFPARDELGKYDVYMMNLFDNKDRRITHGSGEFIHSAIISPDVSTIIYSRGVLQRKIYSVSTSSGEEKMIMEGYGIWIFQFFPDGKKILYLKWKGLNTPKIRTELWSSNVDGTEEHLYFVDTIKNSQGWRRISYHLSQDGKRVAWIKNFEGYSELIVRDLEKGTDVQITNDKKYNTGAFWTSTGKIIYSSNRSGNWNLWMIDSRGGEPIQLTRGGGSDYLIGISNDDKRILYTQSSFANHIKIGSLVNGNVVQLTTEELPRGCPVISPLKTKIIFTQGEEGIVQNNIYSLNINGKNIQKITNDNNIKGIPIWSPDEKWIAYSAYPPTDNADSSRIFLITADGTAKPKMIGFGNGPVWINDRKLIYSWKLNTYMHFIDSNITEKFSTDSLKVIPVMSERYVVLYDYHKAKLGWWIVDMNSFKESGTKKARLLLKGNIWDTDLVNDKFYYIIEPTTPLHCISLPDGKEIPMKYRIPEINTFNISKDGKEIVFNTRFSRNKFMLLDNPFK